jgi:hypothetical protein
MSEENENWLDDLPEVLREAPFIAKAKSAEDAFGQIKHAASIVGNSLRIPGEDATEEARDEFYQKIIDSVPDVVRLPEDWSDDEANATFRSRFGVPEEAKDYEPADVEDFEWDDSYLDTLRAMAHQAGMSKAQFKRFTETTAAQQMAADEINESNLSEARESLKKEWGAAHGERMQLIENWMKLSDAPEAVRDMAADGNLTPDAANWLYEIASQYAKGGRKVAEDEPGKDKHGLTPLEAQDKIQEILNDKDYFNAASPRQKMLKQRMLELQQMIDDVA